MKRPVFFLIPLLAAALCLGTPAQNNRGPGDDACDMAIQKQAMTLLSEGKLDEALASFQGMLDKSRKEIWTAQALLVCDGQDLYARSVSLEEASQAPVIVIKRVIDSKVCFRICAGVFTDKARAVRLASGLPSPFKEAKPYPLLLVSKGVYAKGAFDLATTTAPAIKEDESPAETPVAAPPRAPAAEPAGTTPAVDPAQRLFLDGLEAYAGNDLDKAEKLFKQSITMKPERFEAYNNLGAIYLQKKRYDDARNVLEKAVQIQPAYANARSNLAGAYWFLGRRAEAISEAQKAFRLDSYNVGYCNNLASFLIEEKRYSEAETYLNIVKIVAPDNQDAAVMRKKMDEALGKTAAPPPPQEAGQSGEPAKTGEPAPPPAAVQEKPEPEKIENTQSPPPAESTGADTSLDKPGFKDFLRRIFHKKKDSPPADPVAQEPDGTLPGEEERQS